MASNPTPQDIEFVIARGEALVSQARGMVAHWEQSLVQMGITPEVARQIKEAPASQDLQSLLKARQQPAHGGAPTGPASPPADNGSNAESQPQGPSLQAARRAVRRLRHV